ncbi:MAG: acyloxyacyl hydrolase [Muribaculaceae bacterium]|nr:acyloxyacyl hydrolase [Muribaculaceae bacterium]
MRRYLAYILLFLIKLPLQADHIIMCHDDSVSNGMIHKVWGFGADVRGAYSFPSFKDDVLTDCLDDSHAVKESFVGSLHLKYGFGFDSSNDIGKRWAGVVQGVGTGIFIPGYPKATGVPVALYFYQGAPIVWLRKNLSLDYEWNFGISAGWKPCDGHTAKSTLIVGSSCNAFINLGIGFRWIVSRNLSITAGLDLSHFSNGNTSFPNPGVNTAGVRIGINRYLGSPAGSTPFNSLNDDFIPGFSYDLTMYGAWRRRVYRGGEKPLLLDGHFPVAGISFAPMYDFRRWFRAGISVDFQYDHSTDLKRHYLSGTTAEDMRFSHIPFFSQICGGVAARAELAMPIFSVNVGIGYNIFGPEETMASYQMANLKVYVTQGLYINIGYQLLNFQKQNNLMLGLGYSFNNSRGKETTIAGIL